MKERHCIDANIFIGEFNCGRKKKSVSYDCTLAKRHTFWLGSRACAHTMSRQCSSLLGKPNLKRLPDLVWLQTPSRRPTALSYAERSRCWQAVIPDVRSSSTTLSAEVWSSMRSETVSAGSGSRVNRPGRSFSAIRAVWMYL